MFVLMLSRLENNIQYNDISLRCLTWLMESLSNAKNMLVNRVALTVLIIDHISQNKIENHRSICTMW
jgi:hypothetical protein